MLALAVVAAGYAWWPRSVREVPPVPDHIEDSEVRAYLEEIRAETLAQRGSAEAWGKLGLAYMANLFDRDADVCFAEAARLDPGDVRWPYVRAIIATKRTPANAVPLLRQAVAGQRPSEEYRTSASLLLGETLLEQGEFDEAERIFKEAPSDRASQARAALGLGRIAHARGDDASAIEHLTTAREHPSSRKQASIQLVVLARARGETAVVETLEQELPAMPDDRSWPDPMLEELVVHKVGRRVREKTIGDLEQTSQFEDAARSYLRQIEERPTAAAYIGAAVNIARLGDYDAANELLGKALALEPDSSQAHYTKALVYFIRAEKEQAATPGSPSAKEWFGQVVVSGQRATELKPDHALAYLMWGLALRHLGDSQAAIEPLRKGVACRPELFDLQFSLGEALLEEGQLAAAKQALENAQRLKPNDPRPAEALKRLQTAEE